MKKGLYSVFIIACCCFGMAGCIKHATNELTIDPTMTAMVGTGIFTGASVVPSVTTSQVNDTTNVLTITGNAKLLQGTPGDQIILTITHYKNLTGTFSLVQGQATETYIHNGIASVGTAGIISITKISSNSITGYFSFTTVDGYAISNGDFNVGRPF